MDPSVPLYERIKFLAIYSSNLDEFFRVRVAALRSFKDLKKKTRKEFDFKPKKELRQIRKIVQEQQQAFGRIFRQEIIPALLEAGVELIPNEAYTSEQQTFARNFFFEKIYPQIIPVYISEKEEEPVPFLKNKGLYFIITFPDTNELALVEIPSATVPRFIELPSARKDLHSISFLDDIIRQNLEEFLERPIGHAYAVKLSRDAEIYIDDEFSGDLVEKIKKGLEERNIGAPTRFLYDSSIDPKVLDRLKQIFDHWGEELEKAGAKVIYSYPGIKVHTKLFLFKREEESGMRYYAYLGTGNFNEKTARIYGDHALLTANQDIAREVEHVFALLERRVIIPNCNNLFVAPFTLRNRFTELVDREIERARAGETAYMILKMNSLEDPQMIQKLYEAGQAGVQIQLIIRGICCLHAGVEGLSENIQAISIVDRFLEHARVYIFGNGGRELLFTASADWMTRNLDHRVEVAIPILDPKLFQELRDIIHLQLSDNKKARYLTPELNNPYKKPLPIERPIRAQVEIYEYLKNKFRG